MRSQQRVYALGRMKRGEMNKTERKYEEHLRAMQARGEVLWFSFEGIKFRLADKTFYTPDFAVQMASGEMQLHEVKGYWIGDARTKIKCAAEMHHPFRFFAVKLLKGQWLYEEIG